jgi:hypothetical protein
MKAVDGNLPGDERPILGREDEHGKRELTARKKAGLWDKLAMKTSGLIGY